MYGNQLKGGMKETAGSFVVYYRALRACGFATSMHLF